MKIGRREERFVHRVMVVAMIAIVMGIGVVVVKESREIQKLIEPLERYGRRSSTERTQNVHGIRPGVVR